MTKQIINSDQFRRWLVTCMNFIDKHPSGFEFRANFAPDWRMAELVFVDNWKDQALVISVKGMIVLPIETEPYIFHEIIDDWHATMRKTHGQVIPVDGISTYILGNALQEPKHCYCEVVVEYEEKLSPEKVADFKQLRKMP